MTDLNERLRGIDRLTPPDLWTTAQGRAEARSETPKVSLGRRFAIIAASLAIGMAAVVVVVFAFRTSPGTTPTTAGWQRGEIEPLGATFQYPSSWHLQPFEEQVGHAGFTGVVVSNVEGDLHHPDLGPNSATSAWDLSGLPPGGVVVSIEHLDAIGVPRSPDSQFPLALADAEHLGRTQLSGETEALWLPFWLNGRHLGARVYFGPEASEDDQHVAADIVASIRPSQMGKPSADPTILVSSSGPSGDQALLSGTLTIDSGCLAVSNGPDSSVYVVWPAGYSLEEGWLLDDSGNQVAAIGDDIEMGGGITNLTHAEPEVVGGIPSSCEVGGSDAYWFAGTPEPLLEEDGSTASVPGLGLDICSSSSAPGTFGGTEGLVYLVEEAPAEGCGSGVEGFQRLAVAPQGNRVTIVGPQLAICRDSWPCRLFAAPDIDLDGTDEVAVEVGRTGGSRLFVLFRVEGGRVQQFTFCAGCADQLAWGGNGGHREGAYCRGPASSPRLVTWAAETDPGAEAGPWDVAEVTHEVEGNQLIEVDQRNSQVPSVGSLPPGGGSSLCGSEIEPAS
jgi:hypothetical protein